MTQKKMCKGTTAFFDGEHPCGNSARPDGEYCWQHDPSPEYDAKRRVAAEKIGQANKKVAKRRWSK